MAWVKLDDAMPHHPKVMAAGPQAFALDVAGICYSNAHGTDGFIPKSSLPAVYPALPSPAKWARKLVEVGRWIEVDGGWQIHDVGDYQPSAADVAAEKSKARERMRRAREQKQRSSPEHHTNNGRSSGNPVPSRPNTVPNGTVRAGLFEAFHEFWLERPYDPDREPNSLERGRINKAVKVAENANYDPDEVRRRGKAYRKKWADIEHSPQALLLNWSRFEPETEIAVCPTCINRGRVGFTESGEPTGMDAPEAVDYGLCPTCHPEVAL